MCIADESKLTGLWAHVELTTSQNIGISIIGGILH